MLSEVCYNFSRMEVRKDTKGFLSHLVVFILVNVLLFIIVGLIALNSVNVLGDAAFWIFFSLINLGILVHLIFDYICLPKVLLTIEDDQVIIHKRFNKSLAVNYLNIRSGGLYPSLRPLTLKGKQLVITLKDGTVYKISYLKNPQDAFKVYKQKFDAYVFAHLDDYYSVSE